MKVIITIQCDNAAFDGRPEDEVARILAEFAERLSHNNFHSFDKLRDINGNTVGDIAVFNQGESE